MLAGGKASPRSRQPRSRPGRARCRPVPSRCSPGVLRPIRMICSPAQEGAPTRAATVLFSLSVVIASAPLNQPRSCHVAAVSPVDRTVPSAQSTLACPVVPTARSATARSSQGRALPASGTCTTCGFAGSRYQVAVADPPSDHVAPLSVVVLSFGVHAARVPATTKAVEAAEGRSRVTPWLSSVGSLHVCPASAVMVTLAAASAHEPTRTTHACASSTPTTRRRSGSAADGEVLDALAPTETDGDAVRVSAARSATSGVLASAGSSATAMRPTSTTASSARAAVEAPRDRSWSITVRPPGIGRSGQALGENWARCEPSAAPVPTCARTRAPRWLSRRG